MRLEASRPVIRGGQGSAFERWPAVPFWSPLFASICIPGDIILLSLHHKVARKVLVGLDND